MYISEYLKKRRHFLFITINQPTTTIMPNTWASLAYFAFFPYRLHTTKFKAECRKPQMLNILKKEGKHRIYYEAKASTDFITSQQPIQLTHCLGDAVIGKEGAARSLDGSLNRNQSSPSTLEDALRDAGGPIIFDCPRCTLCCVLFVESKLSRPNNANQHYVLNLHLVTFASVLM